MSMQVAERQQTSPAMELRGQLQRMSGEFKAVLPSHIPVERFQRVALTATQRDPGLVMADRKSLFDSCLQCAQDGLLPDGREAALVIYNTKVPGPNGKDVWIKMVQYIPMIAGIRKKVRQSGDIVSWEARLVHENDEFDLAFGDEERIVHRPNLFNPGEIIAVYSIATFKDGAKSRDVMSIGEVQKIRANAKRQSIWNDEVAYPEMVKKTMLRRHSKALPLSAELDELIRRDDALYDLNARPEPQPQRSAMTLHPHATLADFAASAPEHTNAQPDAAHPDGQQAGPEAGAEATGGEPGVSRPAAAPASPPSQERPPAQNPPADASAPAAQLPPGGGADADPAHAAYEAGRRARRAGDTRAEAEAAQRYMAHKRAAAQGWDDENAALAGEREAE